MVMTLNKGLQHLIKRKNTSNKTVNNSSFNQGYDKFIYLVAILGPLVNLPQLFKVWIEKDSSGVSVISWFGFSLISIFWLIYGFIHKDKHIIIMNVLLVVLQIIIAIGALIY